MFACRNGLAQAQSTSTGETGERPIGLPSKIDWTFNVDAAWGSVTFRNEFLTTRARTRVSISGRTGSRDR